MADNGDQGANTLSSTLVRYHVWHIMVTRVVTLNPVLSDSIAVLQFNIFTSYLEWNKSLAEWIDHNEDVKVFLHL